MMIEAEFGGDDECGGNTKVPPPPPATDEEADEAGPEGFRRRFTEMLTNRPSNLPRWMEMLPTV